MLTRLLRAGTYDTSDYDRYATKKNLFQVGYQLAIHSTRFQISNEQVLVAGNSRRVKYTIIIRYYRKDRNLRLQSAMKN